MSTLFAPFFQQVDSNGAPLSGAKLYFYQTGTTTPQDTYTDSGLTTPNANPVVADSNGRWPTIYLGTSSDYKVILKDSSDVAVQTLDPLFAAGTSGRTTVDDTSYTASISDRTIAYTNITTDRTVTLPPAASFPAGTALTIIDESGLSSSSAVISASPNGADTINGQNFAVPMVGAGYGSAAIESDGTSKWTISRRTLDGPTTLDINLTLRTAAKPGWLMMDDGTIGDASSGAGHTGDQYKPLYIALYAAVSDTYAPVTGGRGTSATADWAAHKPIALTKVLGRALAAAGAGSGLTSRALGQTVGEEAHALTSDENGPHTHSENAWGPTATGTGAQTGNTSNMYLQADTGSSGLGTAHNTMQPTSFLNVEIHL